MNNDRRRAVRINVRKRAKWFRMKNGETEEKNPSGFGNDRLAAPRAPKDRRTRSTRAMLPSSLLGFIQTNVRWSLSGFGWRIRSASCLKIRSVHDNDACPDDFLSFVSFTIIRGDSVSLGFSYSKSLTILTASAQYDRTNEPKKNYTFEFTVGSSPCSLHLTLSILIFINSIKTEGKTIQF